ncbi:hypothetical protein CDAR_551271 [Caerostris darwini]|uniref:Uncharacterized protein n=1 Tax=Caerostris darwini TaxID=1538125 RepID=A0AAV4V5S9_9ARAC|nr:hypothetical protein CDAR_551271 [Caerostris darwini]
MTVSPISMEDDRDRDIFVRFTRLEESRNEQLVREIKRHCGSPTGVLLPVELRVNDYFAIFFTTFKTITLGTTSQGANAERRCLLLAWKMTETRISSPVLRDLKRAVTSSW